MTEETQKLNNRLDELLEKIETLESDNRDLQLRLKKTEELVEQHKHGGNETTDIGDIIAKRLGLKVSSVMGASESYFIELGGFKQLGRAAVGYIGLHSPDDNYFRLTWSGGGTPVLEATLAIIPVYANNAAAIAGGLVAGQVYRTNGNPDALCIVH